MTTLYFLAWVGVLVVLKKLVLADYRIEFRGFAVALVGALLVAKIVVMMEHVPLGAYVGKLPVVVAVVARTTLYGVVVAVALLLEKAFEARHEYGGFGRALANVFHHRDIYHLWANSICLACALFQFNALSVVRRHVGDRGLIRLFFSPAGDGSSLEPPGK